MSSPLSMYPGDAKRVLAQLWDRSLPLLRERVASLEAAVTAAELGLLAPAQRARASDLAHKLSGSLGMFGYMEGTEVAREIESLLEGERPFEPSHLRALCTRLCAVLPL